MDEERTRCSILKEDFIIISFIHSVNIYICNVPNAMPGAYYAAVNKTKSLPSSILHSRRRDRQIKCKEINVIFAGSVLKKLEGVMS